MLRSTVLSTRCPSWFFQLVRYCVLVLSATALNACGNSCFLGFVNNGNGGAIIKTGNPSSSCTLPQTTGMMSVVAVKQSVCDSCSAAARPLHTFVTLHGVQLRTNANADSNSSGWLEIAPQLAAEPRQIDLIGGSGPEILVEAATIPAGVYRQIRLLFLPDSSPDARHSFVVSADSQVDSLVWPALAPELLIGPESIEGGSLVLLPDAKTALWLSFESRRALYSSGAEPPRLRTFLAARASTQIQSSAKPF